MKSNNDLTTSLLAISVSLTITTTLVVAGRLWVRLGIKNGVGWEDGLVTISWACAMAQNVTVILATKIGLGLTHENFEQRNMTYFLQLNKVMSMTYSCSITAIKASFAVMYLRILEIPRPRVLLLLNKIILVTLALQATEETVIVLFGCWPVEKSWKPSIEGTCINLEPVWYTGLSLNLVFDLILFIEPIPWLWGLRLTLAKRLGLIAMMSLGLLVVIISAKRIMYVIQTAAGDDPTYDYAEPVIWSQVEVCVLIICSCLPCLRQCMRQIQPGRATAEGKEFEPMRPTQEEKTGWMTVTRALPSEKRLGESNKMGVISEVVSNVKHVEDMGVVEEQGIRVTLEIKIDVQVVDRDTTDGLRRDEPIQISPV